MAKTIPFNLKSFNDAPDSAKARVNTVAALYGVSIPTIWRRVRTGLVPAPHKIGGSTVWNVGDLRRALARASPHEAEDFEELDAQPECLTSDWLSEFAMSAIDALEKWERAAKSKDQDGMVAARKARDAVLKDYRAKTGGAA